MKVLVTGATGFVGSHLCERLNKLGHCVYIVVRNEQKAKKLNLQGTIIQGDLSTSSIMDWVAKLPIDLDSVIHIAGIVHSFDISQFHTVNTYSTQELHSQLKGRYNKLHFIYISSLAASGPAPTKLPLIETDPLIPCSAYGVSKKEAESFLTHSLDNDWRLTIIRPPMVIGPRDPAVLDIFKMVSSRIILETGLNGKNKRYSIVGVFDLVELITLALKKQTTHKEVFFSSYPQTYRFSEIIESIENVMGKRGLKIAIPMIIIVMISHLMKILNKILGLDFRLSPDKTNELGPDRWICSGLKSQKQLQMNYQWDLDKIIKKTYNDYKERGWL